MFLRAFLLASVILTLMAVVDLEFFRACSQRYFFFFSFQAFRLEVLLFSEGKECDSFGFWAFSEGSSWGSRTEEVWDLIKVAGQLPCGKCWSMSRTKRMGKRLTFAPASIVFSHNSSQISFSYPRCSIWVAIESLSPSWKIWMRVDFLGALRASNSIRIDCRYSR